MNIEQSLIHLLLHSYPVSFQEAILTGQRDIDKGLRLEEFIENGCDVALIVIPSQAKVLHVALGTTTSTRPITSPPHPRIHRCRRFHSPVSLVSSSNIMFVLVLGGLKFRMKGIWN